MGLVSTLGLGQVCGLQHIDSDERSKPMASVPDTAMTGVEISKPGGPEVLVARSLPTPKPGAGQILDQGGRGGRQSSRRAAAHRCLSAAARTFAAAGSGDRRHRGGGRRAGRPLEGRRQGVCAGERRRLCRICDRRRRGGAADPRRARHGAGGGRTRDLLHGVEQRIRARASHGRANGSWCTAAPAASAPRRSSSPRRSAPR